MVIASYKRLGDEPEDGDGQPRFFVQFYDPAKTLMPRGYYTSKGLPLPEFYQELDRQMAAEAAVSEGDATGAPADPVEG